MNLYHLFEDAFTDRLKSDQKLVKMLYIAMKHDNTLPPAVFGLLGINPTSDRVVDIWTKLLNNLNKLQAGGVISPDNKFYGWVTKMYANGGSNWENLISRGKEQIQSYYLLQRRNMLQPKHQDLNTFANLSDLERVMGKYRDLLKKYQEEEQLKQLTKDAKEIVIVDNESYYVSVPLNYGGSCRLARSVGEFANWCTGTTSSNHYFNHYSKQGPLIVFIDKNNPDNKYQLHAPSDQFKDKKDAEIDRENFAKRYPNAMNDIIAGLQANADKLTDYQNMPAQIKLVQNRFKSAFGKTNDLEGGDPDWIAANR